MALQETIRSAAIKTALLRERWQNGTVYNPVSARMTQDPYPDYSRLRSRSPAHRSRLMNAWVFSRYADVDAILRDHRHFSSDPTKRDFPRRQQALLPARDDYTMLIHDPPDHTRLRALVSKAFTRREIDALEPRIRGVILLPFDVCLHVDRWHDLHLMAELADLSAPVVRARASLHRHQATRLRRQKTEHLRPDEFFRNATDPSGRAPWS